MGMRADHHAHVDQPCVFRCRLVPDGHGAGTGVSRCQGTPGATDVEARCRCGILCGYSHDGADCPGDKADHHQRRSQAQAQSGNPAQGPDRYRRLHCGALRPAFKNSLPFRALVCIPARLGWRPAGRQPRSVIVLRGRQGLSDSVLNSRRIRLRGQRDPCHSRTAPRAKGRARASPGSGGCGAVRIEPYRQRRAGNLSDVFWRHAVATNSIVCCERVQLRVRGVWVRVSPTEGGACDRLTLMSLSEGYSLTPIPHRRRTQLGLRTQMR